MHFTIETDTQDCTGFDPLLVGDSASGGSCLGRWTRQDKAAGGKLAEFAASRIVLPPIHCLPPNGTLAFKVVYLRGL